MIYANGRVRKSVNSKTVAQISIKKDNTSSGGKSLDEIKVGAKLVINPNSNLDQWEKLGDFNTTYEDFNDLVGEEICKETNRDKLPKVIRVVTIDNHPTLPSGTTVIARNFSSGSLGKPANEPTLELQYPKTSVKQDTKIRYVSEFK